MANLPNTSSKAFMNKPAPVAQQPAPPKIPSIRDNAIFKPEMTKPVAMEDISAMILTLCKSMEKQGFDFKSTEDNDKFFTSLQLFLEETFNYPDFRNKQQG
jgi:hypothetical protein